MTTRLEQILETVFQLEEHQGENKVTSLSDAIQHNIKPGMTLHFGEAANALASEVVRQFWGKSPNSPWLSACLESKWQCLSTPG